MSGREWKAGDVAMRSSYLPGVDDYMSVATTCYDDRHGDGLHWHHVDGGWDPLDSGRVTYRPLVVIDPEDREQVERLTDLLDAHLKRIDDYADAVQAALREFANPTPPKPEEPTGLGAVVEDDRGARWARVRHLPSDDLGCDWVGGVPARWAHYEDIDVVRVVPQ